ncbi:hypothetical protein BH09MYX1_BH09MYX1_37980 [soil metagenome]
MARMRLRDIVVCAAAFLSIASMASVAEAAVRDPAYEAKLDAQLSAIDPTLVPKFRQATVDLDDDRAIDATNGFESVHRAAPQFTAATRRLCRAEISQGAYDQGLAHCQEAVDVEHSSDNLTMLALALFASNAPPSITKSLAIAREAVDLEPTNVDANAALCLISKSRSDIGQFRVCAKNLLRLRPEEPSTHFFAAQIASNDEDYATARTELDEAHRLGLNENDYQAALEDLKAANPWYKRALQVAKWFALGWLGLFVLIALFGSAVVQPLRRQVAKMRRKPPAKIVLHPPSGLGVIARIAAFAYATSGAVWVLLVAATTAVVAYGTYIDAAVPWKILGTLVFITVYIALSVVGGLRPPDDASEEGALDLEGEPEWRPVFERMEKKLDRKIPSKLWLVEGQELALIRDGSTMERLAESRVVGVRIGRDAFEELNEQSFAARYGQALVAAGGTDSIAYTSRFGTLLARLRREHQEGGSSGYFSAAYWIIRIVMLATDRMIGVAEDARELLGDEAAAKHFGRDALLEGLHATGGATTDRLKVVKALKESAESEGTSRPLWELFGDADAARKTLEGAADDAESDDADADSDDASAAKGKSAKSGTNSAEKKPGKKKAASKKDAVKKPVAATVEDDDDDSDDRDDAK